MLCLMILYNNEYDEPNRSDVCVISITNDDDEVLHDNYDHNLMMMALLMMITLIIMLMPQNIIFDEGDDVAYPAADDNADVDNGKAPA